MAKVSDKETLHCEAGDHDYERDRKRGPKPKNCSKHRTQQDDADAEERQRRLAAGRLKAQQERNSVIITEVLEKERLKGTKCSCVILPDMTLYEINRLGAGCKTHWVCPVLDRVRRALGH